MIKYFDEFERHFGARKPEKKKLDWKLIGLSASVSFLLGYAVLIQLW